MYKAAVVFWDKMLLCCVN